MDNEAKTLLDKLENLFIGPIDEHSIVEIEKTLRNERSATVKTVLAQVVEIDGIKGTLLDIAIQKINLDLIEILVSFDTVIDAKTQLELIENLITNSKERENNDALEALKKIKSFLIAREKWQQYARDQGISLNRVVRLLESGIDAIPAINEDVVLIYGETQIGKSTLINYVYGTEYQLVKESTGTRSFVERSGGAEEIMGVGDGRQSETICPKVAPSNENRDYSFVDMPGFGDTRSIEERITVMSSNKMFIHKLGNQKIKGILYVVAYDALNEGAYNSLRERLPRMARVLNNELDNLLFIVTKAPNESGLKSKIIEELGKFYNTIEKEIKESDSDNEDTRNKKDILVVINNLLLHNNRIIPGDVFNTKTRKEILVNLDNLKSKEHNKFNFDIRFGNRKDAPSDDISKFRSAIEYMAKEYVALDKSNQDVQEKIFDLEKDIISKREEIHTIDRKIKALEKPINRPVELDKDSIQNCREDINRLNICIEVLRESIEKSKLAIEKLSGENKKLNEDNSTYLIDLDPDQHTKSWIQKPIYMAPSIWNRFFGTCLDDECISEVEKIHAHDHGRVRNGVIYITLKEKLHIVDFKLDPEGCTYEIGKWSNDTSTPIYETTKFSDNKFTPLVQSSEDFQYNLRNGIFQAKVTGDKKDGRLVEEFKIRIKLFGYTKSKKETIDAIGYNKNKIEQLKRNFQLEEEVIKLKESDREALEIELNKLSNAPKEAERMKEASRKEIKELENSKKATEKEIINLENSYASYSKKYSNNEDVLDQRFFHKIEKVLNLFKEFDTDLFKEFKISVSERFSKKDQSEVKRVNNNSKKGQGDSGPAGSSHWQHDKLPMLPLKELHLAPEKTIFKQTASSQPHAESNNISGSTYPSSFTEQLPLLQWCVHYLGKWFPWNKERNLIYKEKMHLYQLQENLNYFSQKLQQFSDSLIGECGLFSDKLNWIAFRIHSTHNTIEEILSLGQTTTAQLEETAHYVEHLDETLESLSKHQTTLDEWEQEISALSNENKCLQVTYDGLNDVLKKEVVDAYKEDETTFIFEHELDQIKQTKKESVYEFCTSQKFWQLPVNNLQEALHLPKEEAKQQQILTA